MMRSIVASLALAVSLVTFSPSAMADAPAKSPSWLKRTTPPPALKTKQPSKNLGWKFTGAALILSTLVGVSLYARRKRAGALGQTNTHLGILSRIRLGNKSDLIIAEVGQKMLLLGVTDESVNPLAWLEEKDLAPAAIPKAPPVERPTEATTSPFARALKDMMGKRDLPPAEELARRQSGKDFVNVHSLEQARKMDRRTHDDMEEQALQLVQQLRSKRG